MNIFSWNITFKSNKEITWIDYDYVENLSKDWNKVLFIFWETDLKKSEELAEFFTEKLWELENYDISISTEDKIDVLHSTYAEWVYELASFEWEETTFEEILERFNDFDEVVTIREAEISKRFWNRVIKVDFVY
jgi:hypothetical protein